MFVVADLKDDRAPKIRHLIQGAQEMQRISYAWVVKLAAVMLILPGFATEIIEEVTGSATEGLGLNLLYGTVVLVTFSFYVANYYVARTFQRTHPSYRFPVVVSIVCGILALANFIPPGFGSSQTASLFSVIGDIGFVGMGSVTVYAVIKDLLRNSRVDSREIWGGIAVYVLMGVIFSYIYGLVVVLEPYSFTEALEPGITKRPELLYFSFVTQMTVGYGDIIPVSTLARSLVIVHGAFGVLYPPIFVARLVNLFVQPKISGQSAPVARTHLEVEEEDEDETASS